jgi:sugar lactone lactonase YvrE
MPLNSPHGFLSRRRQRSFLFLLAYGMGAPLVFSQTITTVAGNGNPGFSGDGGPAISAMLSDVNGLAADAAGNLYIVDSSNQRVRRVDQATQAITTVAGDGIFGFSGDGGPATAARFDDIQGVALDLQGDLFIADTYNFRVRKIDQSTGAVKTVAGDGAAVFAGDGGPATLASLRYPCGVALDAQNNIYIADSSNNRIRRVDAMTGIMTTVAGNGNYGFSGDGGPALQGEFRVPYGVAVDSQGNLFIADTANNRIRRVDSATGLLSTVAGNGVGGFGGDGGPAVSAGLYSPWGVILDTAGSFFIADYRNQRVRKVDGSTGVISTVAGTGIASYSGDGGPAILADLHGPSSVAKDGAGNLYIGDDNNSRVRKVAALLVVSTPAPTSTITYTPTSIPTSTPALTATPTPSFTPTASLLPTVTYTPTTTHTPVCETHVWPDPFDPHTAVGGVLKVGCVPYGGTVCFFTLSGERVRNIPEAGGMALWDGRNQYGILVSPGVYFYAVQQGEKTVQSGKLIVRTSVK